MRLLGTFLLELVDTQEEGESQIKDVCEHDLGALKMLVQKDSLEEMHWGCHGIHNHAQILYNMLRRESA